jgi:hypothetical protein
VNGLAVVGVLGFVLLLGIAVAMYYRAVTRKRRALQRQREIQRAARLTERRIRAHYQQAAWTAAQHMVQQHSARAKRR